MGRDLSGTKERKKSSTKSFALPGKRKYPIPDKAHARNARHSLLGRPVSPDR